MNKKCIMPDEYGEHDDACPYFDGKRCEKIGFRPGHYVVCSPYFEKLKRKVEKQKKKSKN